MTDIPPNPANNPSSGNTSHPHQFMITEYDKIATAYFGLRDQMNEWFKAYLTLVGFPLTILAAVLKLEGGNSSINLMDLPDFVAALLILVALLGLFVTLSIISMRMEMILYARTINLVRRYFGEQNNELPKFFVLPTSDSLPPFFEKWSAMFWQVFMIGVLDSIILFGGTLNFLTNCWALGISISFLFLHMFVYYFMARGRQENWNIRYEENLSKPQY